MESLLLEDDENVELWYMMGVAALTKDPADVESARFHLDRTKEMLDELLTQFQATGSPIEVQYFPTHYCRNKEQQLLIILCAVLHSTSIILRMLLSFLS